MACGVSDKHFSAFFIIIDPIQMYRVPLGVSKKKFACNYNEYFFNIIFAGAGFSNISGECENVVFIIKSPRNRNKCFQK